LAGQLEVRNHETHPEDAKERNCKQQLFYFPIFNISAIAADNSRAKKRARVTKIFLNSVNGDVMSVMSTLFPFLFNVISCFLRPDRHHGFDCAIPWMTEPLTTESLMIVESLMIMLWWNETSASIARVIARTPSSMARSSELARRFDEPAAVST
jgi:hypothetical protein